MAYVQTTAAALLHDFPEAGSPPAIMAKVAVIVHLLALVQPVGSESAHHLQTSATIYSIAA